MDEKTDRHLQAPQEANRDKHINFKAIEDGDEDPATEYVEEETSQALFKQQVHEGKNPKTGGSSGTIEDDQAH